MEKLCSTCGKNPRVAGQRWCQPCRTEYMRGYRARNPTKISAINRRQYVLHQGERLQEAREYRFANRIKIQGKAAELKQAKRDFVMKLKAETPCTDCGLSFPPMCMDFDHVRGVKKYNIAQMAGGAHSFKAMLEEIEKCELVCACCHRVRTVQRRGVSFST